MRKIRVNRHFAEYVRPVTQRNQHLIIRCRWQVYILQLLFHANKESVSAPMYVYIFNLLVFLPVSFNSFEYFVSGGSTEKYMNLE